MKKLYTQADAARALGVNVSTINRWLKAGGLKAITMPSGRVRLPASEIARLCGQQ